MKITEYGTIRSAADIKRRGKAGSASAGSFADMLDAVSEEDAQTTGQLSDVTATADISVMLTLQEVSEEETNRKKLLQQGKSLVDELETLRQRLLSGNVTLESINNLKRKLSYDRQSVSDPALLALLDDIELRAAVEQAKLEMAAKSDTGSLRHENDE